MERRAGRRPVLRRPGHLRRPVSAILGQDQVVRFNLESAELTLIGHSLEDWAQWLLSAPNVNGAHSFAFASNQEDGPLEPNKRLIPLQLFVTDASYDFDNLSVKDAALAVQIRGPITQLWHPRSPLGSIDPEVPGSLIRS